MKKYDFKEEWPRVKKQLEQMSRDAVVLAKKGQEEFIKISHHGKLRIDSAALSLRKEHLFHLIGKEYVSTKEKAAESAKMGQYMTELEKVEKEISDLQNRMKQRPSEEKKAPLKKKNARSSKKQAVQKK